MPDRSKMTWTTDANGGGQTGLYTVNGTEYKAYVRNNGSWALYRSGSHVILAQGKEPGVIGAKTAARKAAEKQPESPTRAESLLSKISESEHWADDTEFWDSVGKTWTRDPQEAEVYASQLDARQKAEEVGGQVEEADPGQEISLAIGGRGGWVVTKR